MSASSNILTALSRAGLVAWKDLVVQFQSPILVVFVVIMPLAMILITGLAFKGFEPHGVDAVVAVVVPGDPARAKALADELRHAPEMNALKADKKQPGVMGIQVDFKPEEQLTEKEAEDRLGPKAAPDRKLSGVLFYDDPTRVRLLVGAEQSFERFAVVSTVERVLGKTERHKKAGGGDSLPGWEVVSVKGSAPEGAGFSSFSQAVAGNGVMFILLNCVMSGAFGLIKERRQHTLDRLLIAPLSRGTILSGKILGVFALGVLQAVVIFGFGAIVLRVPMGNLLGVVVVTLVFILVGCSLGLMISALARREENVQVLGGPVGLVMTALGGGMFPVEQSPPWMQWVALVFPTGWAMNAYHQLMWENAHVWDVWLNLLVLAGFSAGFFLIGVRSLHWE
jgi:ABC-type multidrug transport system permease subunit